MCEDVDLYDDLPILNFGESISKIEEERQYFKKQSSEKEKDIQKLTEQVVVLEKDKKTLEENISSLYKTAVSEIKRKDQIIEGLRKERDSIIFRRQSRQSHSVNRTSHHQKYEGDISSGFHQDPAPPVNLLLIHGESTLEKSQKTVPVVISSSESKPKDSDKNVFKSSENYPSSNEKKEVFPHKGDSDIKDTMLQSITSENICSNVTEVSLDNLSSHQSCISSRSKLPAKSCSVKRLKDLKGGRSLSSENRRESKYKPSDNSFSYRTRPNSLNSRYKSPRSYKEKSRRDDKSWYYSDDKKYYRDEYKECVRKDKKFKVHSNNEFNGKYNVHSRRSPSPNVFRRYALSSNQRYSDAGYLSSKVGRNTKMQSDNVRLATQLKFKYSKAMRERSASCSPEKRKGFIQKSYLPVSEFSKSPNVVDKSTLKLNLEESVSVQQADNKNLNSKNDDKTLPNCNVRSTSPTDCTMCMKQACDKCKKYRIENSLTWKQGVEVGPNCTSFPEQSNKLKCKRELSSNKSSSGAIVQDKLPNVANTHIENCDVELSRKTDASELMLRNISSLEECASGVNKIIDDRLVTVTCDSSENTDINKNLSEKKSAVISGSDCHSLKISSNFHGSIETTNSEKSFLMRNADTVKLSSKEESSHEEFCTRLSTTPPSKNLTPLKISPSFENPAIVKEDKFSHCVFNEQCEFKRHKQKRFKKLLVTEIKNENCTASKEREYKELNNEQHIECDSSGKSNVPFGKPENSDSTRDCVLDDQINLLNTENISLKDNIELNNYNTFPKRTIVNDISRVDNNNESGFNPNPREIVTVLQEETSDVPNKTANILDHLPNKKLHKHKSPNKKRKLDSICEELKANLEKKTVADGALPGSGNILSISEVLGETNIKCNNKNKNYTSSVSNANNLKCADLPRETAVISNEAPKRIVVSKRRRRIPNLQDNVVQVLTQVKSTIP